VALPRITYHTSQTWVQAIHRLAKTASTCRVAVAYCGREAYKFFPELPAERPEDLRVIVDASEPVVRLGLTNAEGVKHLLGLPSQVRTLAALHAKVFVFDQRAALVGSTNMSASSIAQFQLGLEIWDSRIVRQLVAWFDNELWEKAKPVDSEAVRRLMRLSPPHDFGLPGRRTTKLPKLPLWRGEAPQPPPGPSDFTIAASKPELKRLLAEFGSNKCKYRGGGVSCSEVARSNEERYKRLGKEFRSLWRRRASWGKTDLEQLFDLAYTHGRAAKIRKPEFVRQDPGKVAHSLLFLLEDGGDPYVRFEKVLARKSKYKLHGMGEVGIIFLMHLWKPEEFAVVDKPVDDALKALVSFGRPVSRRKGQGFKDRTAAVKHIAKITGLKTLGRVDHFLDAIGKKHISQPRLRRP